MLRYRFWLIHLFTLSLFAVVVVVVVVVVIAVVVKVLWYLYLEQVCGFRNIGVRTR